MTDAEYLARCLEKQGYEVRGVDGNLVYVKGQRVDALSHQGEARLTIGVHGDAETVITPVPPEDHLG